MFMAPSIENVLIARDSSLSYDALVVYHDSYHALTIHSKKGA